MALFPRHQQHEPGTLPSHKSAAFILSSDSLEVKSEQEVLNHVLSLIREPRDKKMSDFKMSTGSTGLLRVVRWQYLDPAAALKALSSLCERLQRHAAAVIKVCFMNEFLSKRPPRKAIVHHSAKICKFADYTATITATPSLAAACLPIAQVWFPDIDCVALLLAVSPKLQWPLENTPMTALYRFVPFMVLCMTN